MSAVERAAEIAPCTCHETYTGRRLRDPNCHGCEVRDTVEQLADEGLVTDQNPLTLEAQAVLDVAGDAAWLACCAYAAHWITDEMKTNVDQAQRRVISAVDAYYGSLMRKAEQ